MLENRIPHPFNITNQPLGNSRNINEFNQESRVGAYTVFDGSFGVDMTALSSSVGGVQKLVNEFPNLDINEIINTPFWQVFVTSYVESHSEGHITIPTFSDVYVGSAMGANPIRLSITGFIPCNPVYNAKLDFLSFYNLFLRGSRQKINKLPFVFTIGNVNCNIRLSSIEVTTDTNIPDFVSVSIQGTGYKYYLTSFLTYDYVEPSNSY